MCIQLQDRNDNMMDIGVTYEVELATGAIKQTIRHSACPGSKDMSAGCHVTLATGAADKPAAKPFDITDGALVDHGKVGAKLSPADYHEDSISPSGKWAVIGGNMSEGDYIHRDLFLLDRDSGKLYPLPETTATWPAPLAAADLAKLGDWSEKTTGAVGETAIVWLGNGDTLNIDHALIVPGSRIVQLAGALAR